MIGEKLDVKFMYDLCRINAGKSKDPSTQVGAVIFRPDMTIASMGRNGFEIGANDDPALFLDRSYKLANVFHAEHNAIRFARESLVGYGICVWPLPPCECCVARLLESGITTVVCPKLDPLHRWYDSCNAGKNAAISKGVRYVEYFT